MGRITLFTREQCPFCIEVGVVLRAAMLEALRMVCGAAGDTDFGIYGLELAEVDVTHDLARATQCKRLSGAATVPQVFLNVEHIGDCGATEGLFRSGRLVPRLVELASAPPANFPPPPDAEVLKITNELACSAQLADGQLLTLRQAGVRALVSLIHPSEPGFRADEAERAALAGLTFVALPPHNAPVIGTGVVAGRVPASWAPHNHATSNHVLPHHHYHHPHRSHGGTHALSLQQLQHQRWQNHLETLPELAETGQDVLPLSPTSPPPPHLLIQLPLPLPVAIAELSPTQSPPAASPPASSPLAAAAAAALSADYAAADDLFRARKSSDADDAGSSGACCASAAAVDAPDSPHSSWGRLSAADTSQPSIGRVEAQQMVCCRGEAQMSAGRRAAMRAAAPRRLAGEAAPPAWPLSSRARPQHAPPPLALAAAAAAAACGPSPPTSPVLSGSALRRLSVHSAGSALSGDSSVHAFDPASGDDLDLGGRSNILEACYTADWARGVLSALATVPKPAIVECRSGVASAAMVLANAAKQRGAGATQVHAWARSLGVDFEPHPDLAHALSQVLHAEGDDGHETGSDV